MRLVGVLSSVVEEKCLVNQSLSGAQLVLERDPTIVLTLPHHHQPPRLAPVAYSTTKDQINRAMSSAVQIGRYYRQQGLFNNGFNCRCCTRTMQGLVWV